MLYSRISNTYFLTTDVNGKILVSSYSWYTLQHTMFHKFASLWFGLLNKNSIFAVMKN